MTNEHAIAVLMSQMLVIGKGFPKYQAAMETAISALREVEERGKGCNFCCYAEHPDKKLYPKEKDGFDFYAGAWKQIAPDNFIEDETDTIKFCPMCGRKLK